MSKNEIVSEMDRILKTHADPKFAESRNRIINTDNFSYGVKVPLIRQTVNDYLNNNSTFLNSHNGIENIRELLASEIFDVQMTGVLFAAALNKTESQPSKENLLNIYSGWIESYIRDWAVCDTFGTEVLSPMLQENAQSLHALHTLSTSENPWSRRISLVALIKARKRFNNWDKVLDQILTLYTEEKNPIVKKAILWAKGFAK